MKIIGVMFCVIGIVLLTLNIRSIWRDYSFREMSHVVPATVLSADVKLVKGLARKSFVLTFMRDESIDTINHIKSESFEGDLPTKEELLQEKWFVRYIPKDHPKASNYRDYAYVSRNPTYKIFSIGSIGLNCIFIMLGVYIILRTRKTALRKI